MVQLLKAPAALTEDKGLVLQWLHQKKLCHKNYLIYLAFQDPSASASRW